MSKVYKQALRDYQEKIAGVLIVQNIISDLEPYLTKVEYLQVKSKLGNMAQVDELFRILLTKGNRHFKGFCHVLEDNGYQHCVQQLRSSIDGAETEGADQDSAPTAPSEGTLKRYFVLHVCHMYKHTPVTDVRLQLHYIHTTHYLVHCVQMCVCCPMFALVFCISQLCTHCVTALLCRIPRRWWLKVSAGSYDTSLLPSSPMDQAEDGREMEGEVVFMRDTRSNLLKAVSGTEWMYRRGALERGRRVSVPPACCICVSAYT